MINFKHVQELTKPAEPVTKNINNFLVIITKIF